MTSTKSAVLAAPLWTRYKVHHDRVARDELIVLYAPLVKYVAGRLAIGLPSNVDRDDLYSYGVFGLIDAIEKFDPTRGLKFETYAVSRVRGSMFDGLRAMDWVPASVRQRAKELEKLLHSLSGKLGRVATDQEVAEAMGITEAEYQKLLHDLQATSLLSLDEPWTTDGGKSESVRLLDTLIDVRGHDPVTAAEVSELRNTLIRSIDRLPEKERLVITLYYYEDLTLKEIGSLMNLSESRISQLHTKAILRLRGQLSRHKKKLIEN
ncbi:FliA/WhiG family RNA polymerase sigma factor [Heliophilum fasciatum]|uniref:RNA polymerase sigma-28 (SigD/FliA/WhiG) subunit n=1 Tax=Heliophilum fasciatum TaxID=35700 RepID=A0A4R2RMX1_9FIRM|nr:FliA/WhiG family RNA polymerase sigma factor [Heliophilum fasciatum]MCW2277917.1 RNA polymerase sigma factor for flagellar operon FliA [Heliophilum fasciatum]TCP64513.1 RNA polymerase sigma-28 (SigD/FliA/WhiG) subunit [Heliophilum fasciatum]